MAEDNEVVQIKETEPTAEKQEEALRIERERLLEEVNKTANQYAADGSVEVEGKLPVPLVEVVKRGQVKHTNEKGELVKELADENDERVEREKPDYLVLHEKVLAGGKIEELNREFEETVKEEEDVK